MKGESGREAGKRKTHLHTVSNPNTGYLLRFHHYTFIYSTNFFMVILMMI